MFVVIVREKRKEGKVGKKGKKHNKDVGEMNKK